MNERLLKILLSPLVTEKSTLMNSEGQYAFKVAKDATKTEIKAAVETLLKVKVETVRTVNLQSRKIRVGRTQGTTKAWKKAYVKVSAGSEIDFTGSQA